MRAPEDANGPSERAEREGHVGHGQTDTSVAARPVVLAWRNAVRDSDLNSTAKLAAFVLSTYMNAAGAARPTVKTVADGASLSERAAGLALERVEVAGFLAVSRSKVAPRTATAPSYRTPNQVRG